MSEDMMARLPVRPAALVAAGVVGAVTAGLWRLRAGEMAASSRLRARLEHGPGAPVCRFAPAMVADLPEAARRYLLHAIQPGTPLAHAVRLSMTGAMRLGPGLPWLPLTAQQVLAPPAGFLWEASVGAPLLRFVGGDSYANGQGRTAFRLWDLVPVVAARGPDVSRAARGRLAIESIWQPAALLPQRGAAWEAIDARTARATVTIDGEPIPLTLTVEEDGRLRSIAMARWGNLAPDGRYRPIPFGATILAEGTFEGYTIPARVEVRWWHGTDHPFDFFRADVTGVSYLPPDERSTP